MSSSNERSTTAWGDRTARREDILTAGEELLKSGGYDGLRMRDVATGAGISLGAVYTYFPNKENLFAAIFTRRITMMLNELEPKLLEADSYLEAFILVLNAYRETYSGFGRQFDALSLSVDSSALLPDIESTLRSATLRIITALAQSLTRFGYAGSIDLAMTLLWSAVTGLANHFAGPRQDLMPVDWDSAVDFAGRTLGIGLGLQTHT